MIKTLNNTIKQDRTAYKIPRSVQDVIPIQRIFADGIFQFGTKYSRTLRFSDINYAIASKEDKTAMFLGYSELLNALDSGSTTKLTICNKQVNRQAFEDTVLLPQRGDSLDGFVDEFNGMLEGKISGSSASVEQERFITVSVHKKNVDEARTFFSRVTGEVSSKLSRLNSSSNELDAAERHLGSGIDVAVAVGPDQRADVVDAAQRVGRLASRSGSRCRGKGRRYPEKGGAARRMSQNQGIHLVCRVKVRDSGNRDARRP